MRIPALTEGMGYFANPMKNPSHPMVKWDGMGMESVVLEITSHHEVFVQISYILRFVAPKIDTHSCLLYAFGSSIGTLRKTNDTKYTSGRQK